MLPCLQQFTRVLHQLVQQDDLTQLHDICAIVCPTNAQLSTVGRVFTAIQAAIGPFLAQSCSRLLATRPGPIAQGEAQTSTLPQHLASQVKWQHVIHAVLPTRHGKHYCT